MISIYQTIAKHLQLGESVILATVIKTEGSTPRKAGAKMAIFSDGTNVGTIGGGSAEASILKHSNKLLHDGVAIIKECNLDDHEAADLGMICGGQQHILLVVVAGNAYNQDLFQTLGDTDCTKKKMHFVTMLHGTRSNFSQVTLRLFDQNMVPVDFQSTPATDEVFQTPALPQLPIIFETVGDHTYLVETLGFQSTMYIFGGGHVARPTVATASMVGFQTVVLDDRSEFANSTAFPEAQEIIILPDYDDPFKDLTIDENSYIVIATRGHVHDQTILSKALETTAAYIGMIGSRRKISSCFKSLKKQGVDETKFARVHAPIGIDIGSETPEEIGVSIVAELIQARKQLR